MFHVKFQCNFRLNNFAFKKGENIFSGGLTETKPESLEEFLTVFKLSSLINSNPLYFVLKLHGKCFRMRTLAD